MDAVDGGSVTTFLVLIALFLLILTVLWTILPVAVFGIKAKLNTVISEQRHMTESINALRKDFRLAADRFAEQKQIRESGPARL